MKSCCSDAIIYCAIIPFTYCFFFLYRTIVQSCLIFPSLSEILKLLGHCGIATVNSSVKFPIVSAHQIIVIRGKEHGNRKERGICAAHFSGN